MRPGLRRYLLAALARDVTVRLRGFTRFSEAEPPEEVMRSSIIGDTVNVAARLTSSAKPMEALMAAEAAQRSGEAGLEPQPPLTATGKGQPLDGFRVVAPSLAPADGRRGAAS